MIYLIDNVLPDGYFGNNLRALSVDMAVFRDLLNMQLTQLSRHLNHLQAAAKDHSTGQLVVYMRRYEIKMFIFLAIQFSPSYVLC